MFCNFSLKLNMANRRCSLFSFILEITGYLDSGYQVLIWVGHSKLTLDELNTKKIAIKVAQNSFQHLDFDGLL